MNKSNCLLMAKEDTLGGFNNEEDNLKQIVDMLGEYQQNEKLFFKDALASPGIQQDLTYPSFIKRLARCMDQYHKTAQASYTLNENL